MTFIIVSVTLYKASVTKTVTVTVTVTVTKV